MQLRPHQQRAVEALQQNDLGQVIVPTGGGKTLIAISDAMTQFEKNEPQVIVVVSPRILLAEQLSSEFLEFIVNANVMHVHTGETRHFRSTQPAQISWFVDKNKENNKHTLIFTTYHSLFRLQQSEIDVNTIYFDEAHNSVSKQFFPATEYFSQMSDRCYFFTATPKHSATVFKPGMNISEVYGEVICKVPAPELVKGGYILPPKVVVQEFDILKGGNVAERDGDNLFRVITENESMEKVLIAAPNTKVMTNMLVGTNFVFKLHNLGYSVMWITAKHGAFIDGKKVNREVFFDTLSEWGKDNDKKFVVLHHSILSEGINVSGLTSCILMRNMDYIAMAQTIGRVIRLHKDDAKAISTGAVAPGDLSRYTKAFGLIHVPIFTKTAIQTAKKLQAVVDTIFVEGEPAVSVVKR